MNKYLFRLSLIAGFIVLSVYFLLPTYFDIQHQDELEKLSGADSVQYYEEHEEGITDARAQRIKLGLDLQGGMYVTLEVNVAEMLEKMAKNRDEKLREIIRETRAEAQDTDEPFLDIFSRKFEEDGTRLSRYYGDIRNSNAEVMEMLRDETAKAVERAVEVINNRINQYGVSESSIQRSGPRRVILELPGVSDEREVRGLIQETAQLEFKLLADPEVFQRKLEELDKYLLRQRRMDTGVDSLLTGNIAVDTNETAVDNTTLDPTAGEEIAATDSAEKYQDSIRQANMTDEERLAEFQEEHPFQALFVFSQQGMFATEENRDRINRLLNDPNVEDILGDRLSLAWGNDPIDSEGEYFYPIYALKGIPELTGEVITNARAQMDPNGMGAVVSMQMDTEGSREWARVTGANVNKQIAIVLDHVVFSAPVVQQKIIGGNSQISGMEDLDEARLIEIVLKAGALPAPVEIIEERTVGPSLGEDSIQKGMYSFLVGLGLVLLFMLVWYNTAGIAADMAVIFNIIFILGILAGFQATLTLPGIAGLLLTVGMAVDANVLINERVREEYGLGKTLRAAIDAGYARAFPAIIDSNITTLITCIILYQFGSGPVKGFALTLMIGIVCSLFTAIVMTRVFFEVSVDNKPEFIKFG
ncbi:MAG: protein translocase subunit SecD [Ectothiorhodospiraceae bacterium]|nr:protein translocase subunit SecD [Ectothiorhodospiraceae bacterium]